MFFISSQAQTTKFENITVKKQITLGTILLKDSTGTFFVNKPIWIKDTLKLGSILLKDSLNHIVIDKLPVFPSLPWIKEGYFSDTSISGSKIKKGSVSSAELSTGLKDSLFNISLYGVDIKVSKLTDSITTHRTSINLINVSKLNRTDTVTLSNRIVSLKSSYNTLFTDAGFFKGDSIPLGGITLKTTNGKINLGDSMIIGNMNFKTLGSGKLSFSDTIITSRLYSSLISADTIQTPVINGTNINFSSLTYPVGSITGSGGLFPILNFEVGGNNIFKLYNSKTVFNKDIIMDTARIQGFKGTHINSDTLITLGSGNFFLIRGTQTINRISADNWQPGSIVTLIFDDTAVLRHNSDLFGTSIPMFLYNSSNWSITANDIITLIYDGTYWREISRTDN